MREEISADANAVSPTCRSAPQERATEPRKCNICGKDDYQTDYLQCEEKTVIDRDGVCFNCAFWTIKVERVGKLTIIDGYVYGPGDRTSGSIRGMAGRRFDIEYRDGRRITTHDLWGGGLIPEVFRDRMPDNARFLGGAERAQAGETTCWNPSDPRAPQYPLPGGRYAPGATPAEYTPTPWQADGALGAPSTAASPANVLNQEGVGK